MKCQKVSKFKKKLYQKKSKVAINWIQSHFDVIFRGYRKKRTNPPHTHTLSHPLWPKQWGGEGTYSPALQKIENLLNIEKSVGQTLL